MNMDSEPAANADVNLKESRGGKRQYCYEKPIT